MFNNICFFIRFFVGCFVVWICMRFFGNLELVLLVIILRFIILISGGNFEWINIIIIIIIIRYYDCIN